MRKTDFTTITQPTINELEHSTEHETLSPKGTSRSTVRQLTNIKVPRETADLVRVYCIFNNKKVTKFATDVLNKELESFRKRLEAMKQLES